MLKRKMIQIALVMLLLVQATPLVVFAQNTPVTSILLYTLPENRVMMGQVELEVGQMKRLSARVFPREATNKKVIWSSSDPSIASVDSFGIISAKREGNAAITARSVSDHVTATAKVNVKPKFQGVSKVNLSCQGFLCSDSKFEIYIDNRNTQIFLKVYNLEQTISQFLDEAEYLNKIQFIRSFDEFLKLAKTYIRKFLLAWLVDQLFLKKIENQSRKGRGVIIQFNIGIEDLIKGIIDKRKVVPSVRSQ